MTQNLPGPIFIFASGQRCGSTLLQRFLCSHPNVLIWGEHDGTLEKIFDQFDHLLWWEQSFGHQFQTYLEDGYHNFIPNMNPKAPAIDYARAQVVRNLWQVPAAAIGKPIWGFKEVLYEASVALELKRLFPDCKVIHHTRSIVDCFISLRHEEKIPPELQPHVPLKQVWTRQRTLEFIDTWIRVNQSFMMNPDLDESWVFHMTYEQLIHDPLLTTQKLVSWIGLEFDDFDQEVFKYKLYTDRHKGDDPRPKVTRADLPPDEIKLLTTDTILELSAMFDYDMSF